MERYVGVTTGFCFHLFVAIQLFVARYIVSSLYQNPTNEEPHLLDMLMILKPPTPTLRALRVTLP